MIRVAVFGSASFDVTAVDIGSVRFGPGEAPVVTLGGRPKATYSDVSGDGMLDLLLLFNTQEIGISPGDIEVCLHGQTGGGAFQGCDGIVTVPPGQTRPFAARR